MCVILYKPAGIPIVKDEFKKLIENGWATNNDGAGFAIIRDNVVYFKKGFMKLDPFLKRMEYARDTDEIIIHMRIATHGGVNEKLTHPFLISPERDHAMLEGEILPNEAILFHNGIARITPPSGESDTSFICKNMKLMCGNFSKPELQDFLGFIADSMGRVIILSNENGQFHIKKYGTWTERDKMFFSNSSCFSAGRYSGSYVGGVYYGQFDDSWDYRRGACSKNTSKNSQKGAHEDSTQNSCSLVTAGGKAKKPKNSRFIYDKQTRLFKEAE